MLFRSGGHASYALISTASTLATTAICLAYTARDLEESPRVSGRQPWGVAAVLVGLLAVMAWWIPVIGPILVAGAGNPVITDQPPVGSGIAQRHSDRWGKSGGRGRLVRQLVGLGGEGEQLGDGAEGVVAGVGALRIRRQTGCHSSPSRQLRCCLLRPRPGIKGSGVIQPGSADKG